MAKLSIDQKNIKDLFEDKKSDFLIPDYQRPYAWEDDECKTLWDDIFEFAFPIIMLMILIVKKNIIWDLLLLLEMMAERKKLLTVSSV